MEVDEDVPPFLRLNDDEVRHVLHAIDRWQREVVFLALVCTRLRDALRRILPNQALCTSIAGAFVCDARVQMCRMHWRGCGLGRCLGEDAAPLNLEGPLQSDRMSSRSAASATLAFISASAAAVTASNACISSSDASST